MNKNIGFEMGILSELFFEVLLNTSLLDLIDNGQQGGMMSAVFGRVA